MQFRKIFKIKNLILHVNIIYVLKTKYFFEYNYMPVTNLRIFLSILVKNISMHFVPVMMFLMLFKACF